MDSMINHYTANRKVRNDDAYSPGGRIGLRPDRATLAYCQRAREAYPGVPVIAGGVEASLRRLAHYDYWSDKVRRSILLDCKADSAGLRHGRAGRSSRSPGGWPRGKTVRDLRDMRGVVYRLGARETAPPTDATTITLPSYEQVSSDKWAFAEMTKITHNETNPYNAKRLVQFHDREAVVANPPAVAAGRGRDGPRLRPALHAPAASQLRRAAIPAYEVVKDSVHDHARLLRRLHVLLDHGPRGADHPEPQPGIGAGRNPPDDGRPEFKGVVSDIGGPTANMYQMRCTRPEVEAKCRRLSLRASDDLQAAGHRPRPARRVDESRPRRSRASKRCWWPPASAWTWPAAAPSTCASWPTHHVGGHLKVAPEHTDPDVLDLMKKPGVDDFEKFDEEFKP